MYTDKRVKRYRSITVILLLCLISIGGYSLHVSKQLSESKRSLDSLVVENNRLLELKTANEKAVTRSEGRLVEVQTSSKKELDAFLAREEELKKKEKELRAVNTKMKYALASANASVVNVKSEKAAVERALSSALIPESTIGQFFRRLVTFGHG